MKAIHQTRVINSRLTAHWTLRWRLLCVNNMRRCESSRTHDSSVRECCKLVNQDRKKRRKWCKQWESLESQNSRSEVWSRCYYIITFLSFCLHFIQFFTNIVISTWTLSIFQCVLTFQRRIFSTISSVKNHLPTVINRSTLMFSTQKIGDERDEREIAQPGEAGILSSIRPALVITISPLMHIFVTFLPVPRG